MSLFWGTAYFGDLANTYYYLDNVKPVALSNNGRKLNMASGMVSSRFCLVQENIVRSRRCAIQRIVVYKMPLTGYLRPTLTSCSVPTFLRPFCCTVLCRMALPLILVRINYHVPKGTLTFVLDNWGHGLCWSTYRSSCFGNRLSCQNVRKSPSSPHRLLFNSIVLQNCSSSKT